MSHKIYPIGIQNFESLRQDGYFYIDKTLRYVINGGGKTLLYSVFHVIQSFCYCG